MRWLPLIPALLLASSLVNPRTPLRTELRTVPGTNHNRVAPRPHLDGALPDPTRRVGFVRDVLPLLQRQGCASAYCHGGAKGRGGLKLSLFGSEPHEDWLALTQALDGRRIDLAHPEQSLILRKPSLRMKHGGGLRLPRRGDAYATLRAWIEQDAPFAHEGEAPLTELALIRGRGDRPEEVRVVATFGTGPQTQSSDVTRLAVLSSSDDRVVTVDDDGRLAVHGPGIAWVFARYGHLSARVEVLQPLPVSVSSPSARPQHHNAIDTAWLARLAQLGLRPAGRAPTHALARRLHLDLVGRPPTPDEGRAFARLPAAERIGRTADRLLADPAFARLWGSRVARWLEIEPRDADVPEPKRVRNDRLRRDVTEALVRGETLVELTRRTLVRDRSLVRRFVDPRDRAEFVGRAFLGVRLGCARCHDHPLDRWRRGEHLAFAAFFTDPRPAGEGSGMVEGKLFHPGTGDLIEPAMLPIGSPETAATGDRAARVADFVLDGGHDLFYRNMANRTFAALLGRGLVEPVDDHRLSNPTAHEALLQRLAEELARTEGDLRALVRAIVTSRTYALDSAPLEDAALDRAAAQYWARREAIAMPADIVPRAVASTLGVDLPGSPRIPDSPLARQLALLNGGLLHDALSAGGTQVDAIADFAGETPSQVDELYLLILSRPPTAAERRAVLPALAGDDRKRALREVAFALLASREWGSIR